MPENRVFLTYRRDLGGIPARALYLGLHAAGIDTFLDLPSPMDDDSRAILRAEIATRPYFLVLFTPGAADRCGERQDWLRWQVEYAAETNRYLIALVAPGFTWPDSATPLGKLTERFTPVSIRYEAIPEGVAKLRTQHLKPLEVMPLDTAPNPAPEAARAAWVARLAALTADPPSALAAQAAFDRAATRPRRDTRNRIGDYSEAVRLYPNFAEAYARRGANRDILDDLEGAAADFDEALRLNPLLDVAYANRGILRNRTGDAAGALSDLTAALHINPTLTSAYYNRAVTYISQNQNDQAVADLSEAIRLDPNAAHFYFQRGIAYTQKGDQMNALADFTDAVRLNPDMAEAYYNRGLIRAKTDLSRAAADWTEAIRADPTIAEAYYNRGLVRARMGDVAGTIEDMTRFLELLPDHPAKAEIYQMLDDLRAGRVPGGGEGSQS